LVQGTNKVGLSYSTEKVLVEKFVINEVDKKFLGFKEPRVRYSFTKAHHWALS
jgi:hypothetical protein